LPEDGDFLPSFRLEDLFVFTCVPILWLVFGDAIAEEQRAELERDRSAFLLDIERGKGAVMAFVLMLVLVLVLAVYVHGAVQ